MKVGYVCGGNIEFSDLWHTAFVEEMRTEKRKEKRLRPRQNGDLIKMDINEIGRNVKKIIEKHVDVSHASPDYQAKLAKAVSVMTNQILSILNGTHKEYRFAHQWFSINNLDYGREYEDLPREFTITDYENSLIEKDLLNLVESINAAAAADLNYIMNECFITRAQPQPEVRIMGFVARQFWLASPDKENTQSRDYEEQARDFLQSLETEADGRWDYETAEKIYQRLYIFQRDCFFNSGSAEDENSDEDIEYEVRKSTEYLYENWCRATERPFIVLCDLFYDIREYSTRHIRGYRYSTIVENSQYYADRYRTDENAWFWKSIDKAWELQSRYHDEGVGKGTDIMGIVVLPYYLFAERLALLSCKCNHLSDESAKEQAITEFINFQYRGYPDRVFLGYPVMYKDICSYLGVNPVNLAAFEETEKEVRARHEKELQTLIEEKKRDVRDRENTANSCFALVYPLFKGNVDEFNAACNRMRPYLVAAEKMSFLEENARDSLYYTLLKIIKESAPHADAEKTALTLMQMYVNIVHLKDRRESTEVTEKLAYYDWDEAIEKFSGMEMSSDASNCASVIKSLLPSAMDWKIKEQVLILEENLEIIRAFYQSWTFEAHNSLWNLINYFQYALDTPAEGRKDGTLSYITMEADKEQVWGSIAQSIYELYCRRFNTLPLDFCYQMKEKWQL